MKHINRALLKHTETALVRASPYTESFWLEYQLNPDCSDYNIVFDQEISGNLNLEKLSYALEQVIIENRILNCHLKQVDGALYWEEHKTIKVLEILLEPEKKATLIKKPFDLEKDHLYRFSIIKCNENSFNAVFVLHHAIIDGNSYAEIMERISFFYNTTNSAKKKCSFEEYNLFCSQMESKILELRRRKSSEFWSKKLKGVKNIVGFPIIKPAKNIGCKKDKKVNHAVFSIKEKFWKDIMLKNKKNISINNFLMLAFGVVFSKYCAKESICINYPIQIKEGGGLYYGSQVNLMLFPIRIEKNDTFNNVICKFKDFIDSLNINTELKHSYLPTAEILEKVKEINLKISFSQSNLNQLSLNLKNCLSWVNLNSNVDMSGSEIWMQYQEDQNGADFRLSYLGNLFYDWQIEGFIDSFKIFLKKIPYSKDIKLSKLSVSSNKNAAVFKNITKNSPEHDLATLFEKQAETTPNNIALIEKNKKLTYRDLNKTANEFASLIYEKIASVTEDIYLKNIVICMDNSIDAIISIISVLKLGACYIPISPGQPLDQIQKIINDANPCLLITSTDHNKNKLRKLQFRGKVLAFDLCLNSNPIINPIVSDRAPGNPAYIIYTSGTTGNPKGVVLAHKGVVNFIYHQIEKFNMTDTERIVLLHSLSFDASIEQIFIALLSGSRLLIYDLSKKLGEKKLIDALDSNKITHLDMTPSFLETYSIQDVKSIKRVITGGESCTPELIKKFNSKNFINEYGPTETSIVCLQGSFRKNETCYNLVGKPIANTIVYIVDREFNIQPIGVKGQILISGFGLALGYLNNSEETNDKFRKNIFASEHEKNGGFDKFYLTGDLGRMHKDGNIEYIGRIDNQIKARGYRIELSAIERVMSNIDNIQKVVVTYSQGKITAYYTSKKSELDKNEIKKYLKFKLPKYMIPDHLIKLENFPVTGNYKIDKKSLPQAQRNNSSNETYVPPSSEIEKIICDSFSEILELDTVGLNDDFFESGGNSLLAVKLTKLINAKNILCNIKVIFEGRSPGLISKKVEVAKGETLQKTSAIADGKFGSKIEKELDFFVRFFRKKNSPFIYLFPPGNSGMESYMENLIKVSDDNMIALDNLFLHLQKTYSTENPNKISCEFIAKLYVKFVKKTHSGLPCILFGWCFGGMIAFEVARQLVLEGISVEKVVLVDSYFNFKSISQLHKDSSILKNDFFFLNHKYSPLKIIGASPFDVILFKAMRIESLEEIKKQFPFDSRDTQLWFQKLNYQYVNHTTDNGFSAQCGGDFIVKHMDATHSSWIENKEILQEICISLKSQSRISRQRKLPHKISSV